MTALGEALAAALDRQLCDWCHRPLPDDGTGRRYCCHTHKVAGRPARRAAEAAASEQAREDRDRLVACTGKLRHNTIEHAARRLLPGQGVYDCRWCDGFHITGLIDGPDVVVVRRPEVPYAR